MPRTVFVTLLLPALLAASSAAGARAQARSEGPDEHGLSMALYWATGGGGTGDDLESAMAAQNFDDDKVGLISGVRTSFPRSEGAGFTGVVALRYRSPHSWTLGASYASRLSLGRAEGHRDPDVDVEARVRARTLGLTVGASAGPLRAAVGPAIGFTETRVTGDRSETTTETRVGALGELRFSLPLVPGRLGTEALLRYVWLGDTTVGPASLGAATFAETSVSLRHWLLGLGVRVRP